MDLKVLNGLLTPKSVAIVGASATPGKIGHTVVKNLQESKYKGGILSDQSGRRRNSGLQMFPLHP